MLKKNTRKYSRGENKVKYLVITCLLFHYIKHVGQIIYTILLLNI